MKKVCIQCGKEFELTKSEMDFYRKKKLAYPKRCKECRAQNKQNRGEAAGKRAYKHPQNGDGKYHAQPHNEEYGQAGTLQNGENVQNEALKNRKSGQNGTLQSGEYGQGGTLQNGEKKHDEYKGSQRTSDMHQPQSDNRPLRTQKKPIVKHGGILAAAAVIIAVVMLLFHDGNGKTQPTQPETTGITYTFRTEEQLEEHYEKHGVEMGFSSAEEYLEAANAVVADADALHKLEAEDNDDVYYLEETNEFVVVSTDGYIRTYFKPDDGIAYYEKQ